jgi:hypothetical protein
MAQITEFNPVVLAAIREKMKTAMAEVEKEFGIQISMDGIKYMEQSFSVKLNAIVKSGDQPASGAKANTKWVADFHRACISFGFTSGDLGKEGTVNGKKVRLAGMRPRANFPMVAEVIGENRFISCKPEVFGGR